MLRQRSVCFIYFIEGRVNNIRQKIEGNNKVENYINNLLLKKRNKLWQEKLKMFKNKNCWFKIIWSYHNKQDGRKLLPM